jgi:hypothetical protein
MRNFGGFMLLVGILGFLYCSSQLSKTGSVPEGKSISESLEYDAGAGRSAVTSAPASAPSGC